MDDFTLTQQTPDNDCTIGDRVIFIALGFGIQLGNIGTITEEEFDKRKKIYRQTILWDNGFLDKYHYKASGTVARYSDPLKVGDRIIDEEGLESEISLISDSCINTKSPDRITSYNLELGKPNIKKVPNVKNDNIPDLPIRSGSGGKRSGAGRPATGRKLRKTINLDSDYAAKLPDLKMLCDLLDEFRSVSDASFTSPRSQKLREFFKKFDALPKIV